MERTMKQRPIFACTLLFALLGVSRLAEYFILRTDATLLSENFLHKVFGIVVLAILLPCLHETWSSIGFGKNGRLSGIAKGVLLGSGCFLVAYSIECLILYKANQTVSLAFYVSGFALNGESTKQNGILFLVLCIALNLINVWMEEGVFRGLFQNILMERIPFFQAILLIAFLFGIWHWAMPLRDYADGKISFAALFVLGIGYLILAGVMSVKWSLLYKLTGSLWMGLGDHLFNNVVVTNLLHVVSNQEADQIQIVRIMIGQILSFSVVLLLYNKTRDQVN